MEIWNHYQESSSITLPQYSLRQGLSNTVVTGMGCLASQLTLEDLLSLPSRVGITGGLPCPPYILVVFWRSAFKSLWLTGHHFECWSNSSVHTFLLLKNHSYIYFYLSLLLFFFMPICILMRERERKGWKVGKIWEKLGERKLIRINYTGVGK